MKLSEKQARDLGITPKRKRPKKADDTLYKRAMFLAACKAHGLPEPIPEYQFAPPRKWRFDWFWKGFCGPSVALEIEGGAWTSGRHTRGQGFLDDIEKYNEATILGYRVIRCTPADVESGAAFALVRRALGLAEEK